MNRKGKIIRLFLLMLLPLISGGCIHNDLPYPWIEQTILSIAAEGESSPASISNDNSTATIYLSEDADITHVRFTEFKTTEGAESSPDLLEGTYDLSEPLKVTLSFYHDYEWTVRAVQVIDRYFTVEGQIGDTELDADACSIKVYVLKDIDLGSLTVKTIKLGPTGITTLDPDIRPGETIDLSSPKEVKVTVHGETRIWKITAEHAASDVSTVSVDAWSNVIWAYGAAPADASRGFEYREASSDIWQEIPESYITHTGASYHACIPHLKPLTKYVVRAVSGVVKGNEVTVTTQATEDLPDGNFDQWWQNGSVWNPWNQNGVQFWDTGNKGAATLGKSNVLPSDHVPAGATGKSAKLETKFVGIGSLGKLAAGSIYTGVFKKVDGTNGILGFGRQWTTRPTKLRGYMDYTTAPINYTSKEWTALKNRPDSCSIYIALTDWDEPYEIRTNPQNRHLFDKNSPAVIGYGELILGSNTGGYVPFEIEVKYRSTSRVPKYIQITCAASKYGDFFTGGTGACLYVDQFSLDYDY